MCGHTLRAGGDTLYVMNIFVSAQWLFRVPMTAFFILVLDLPVVWVFSLFLFEELVKFPMFHLRFLKGAWKHGLQAE
jgi:Na+-driven multidrug efflux pump